MPDETLSEREILIREKVRFGLTRKQAEQVIATQEAHDAALEEAAKPAKEKPEKKK